MAPTFLLLAALWAAIAAGAGKSINSFAGPYIVYVERMYMCDSLGGFTTHLRLSHFNPARPLEKQRLTGNVSGYRVTMDDTWWVVGRMALRSNNQWKDNAFVFSFPTGACSAFRQNIPDFFRVMYKLGDMKNDCRIPPAEYLVDNETVEWVLPNMRIFPYGRYRFTMMSGAVSSTPEFCIVAECNFIPRVS